MSVYGREGIKKIKTMRERMRELRYQMYSRRLKEILAPGTQTSMFHITEIQTKERGRLFEGNSITFEINFKKKKKLNGKQLAGMRHSGTELSK